VISPPQQEKSAPALCPPLRPPPSRGATQC